MILTLLASALLMPVTISGTPGSYTFMRDGKPYFVKGVGGHNKQEELAAMGGNSIRTWGVGDDTKSVLDSAQRNGLTVMQGIWLGHKSYFDYKDAKKVAEQKAMVVREVARYKDHPAILLWGIGNEMDLNNDTPELWIAIEDAIRAAKKIDPSHPFSTVIAEISPQKIANIKKYCPSLDVLGINSYGGLDTLPKRLKEAGWTKPYIITEFGYNGSWEVAKTPFGMAFEPNTTEKADAFRTRYKNVILKEKGQLLGSYAFIWDGSKEIPGWFGTYLPSDIRTEQVDALHELWTGEKVANGSPRITASDCDASGKSLSPESMISASITLKDPENDRLTYRWEVRREQGSLNFGGQGAEPQPVVVNGPADELRDSKVSFRAPREAGNYRLYVRAFDGHGNGASANWPFRIQ